MTQKFFISVFIKDKYVNSYYSENLDDLITIKALNKGCEIFICDLNECVIFTEEQVDEEIHRSGARWKKSLERCEIIDDVVVEHEPAREKLLKPSKCWERPVVCAESGQIFSSIRECANHTGIPYMTIVNCIKNKNATRGVHFANVTIKHDDIIY